MKENSNPIVREVRSRRRNNSIFEPTKKWISNEGLNHFGDITHEKSIVASLKAVASSTSKSGTAKNYDAQQVNLQILQEIGLLSSNSDSKIIVNDDVDDDYAERYILMNRTSTKASEKGGRKKKKRDDVDEEEVFDMIRDINDPEHPLTLEQLNVVRQDHIEVNDMMGTSPIQNKFSFVNIKFTPTIPHCSMATLIGLSIRVKLLRSLPSRFKVRVMINPGTHASERAINRQLNDKERVAAALENSHLLDVVNKCIAPKTLQ